MVLMLPITARWRRRRRRGRIGDTASLDSSFIFETPPVYLSSKRWALLSNVERKERFVRSVMMCVVEGIWRGNLKIPRWFKCMRRERPAYGYAICCTVQYRPSLARAIISPVEDTL